MNNPGFVEGQELIDAVRKKLASRYTSTPSKEVSDLAYVLVKKYYLVLWDYHLAQSAALNECLEMIVDLRGRVLELEADLGNLKASSAKEGGPRPDELEWEKARSDFLEKFGIDLGAEMETSHGPALQVDWRTQTASLTEVEWKEVARQLLNGANLQQGPKKRPST